MDLQKLFAAKPEIAKHKPLVFQQFKSDVGMKNPVIFVSDMKSTLAADYFSLDIITDIAYDIHLITFERCILMYLIDIKAPYFHIVRNGMVIKARKHFDPTKDRMDITTLYSNIDDFKVICNGNKTATIFCRDVSSTPKT